MYTKEQMRLSFEAGEEHRGDDYTNGPGFEEFLATLTPEPSADVVERIDSALQPFCHDGDRPVAASVLSDLISAEVERRVSWYREALERIANENHSNFRVYKRIASEALAKGANNENRQ